MSPKKKKDDPSTADATDATNLPDDLAFPASLTSKWESLRQLEERFRCKICYDLFRDPVMTSCGHHFCSLCVRQYYVYHQKCPQCERENLESQLRTDRDLKDILVLLCRVVLPDLEKEKVTIPNSSTPVPKTPVRRSPSPKPSTSKTPQRPPRPASPQPSTSRVTLEPETPAQGPSCPVCNAQVEAKRMNTHLDLCLNGLEDPELSKSTTKKTPQMPLTSPKPASPSPQKTFSFTQPPPKSCAISRPQTLVKRVEMKPAQKLVYHLLKDGELKRKLREAGLPTDGDKKALIARHQRFCVIWNSQIDLVSVVFLVFSAISSKFYF